MAENFNLIFGSQAPTTASWSDVDYQTGWNVVGSTPPTAEQFDALQNRSDKKSQELNNRLSPLEQKAREQGRRAGTAYKVGAAVTVGGLPADWLLVCTTAGTSGTVAITLPNPLLDGATIKDGTITWTLRKVATNGSFGYRQPNTTYTARQIAYHSALPTGYYLECTTAGTTGSGDITPSSTIGGTVRDGTVTWTVRQIADTNDLTAYLPLIGGGALTGSALTFNGNNLAGSAIVAKSLRRDRGYIKYASGLILQWGFTTFSASVSTITFPITFPTANPIVVCTPHQNGAQALKSGQTFGIASMDKNHVELMYIGPAAGSAYDVDWLALGY